MLDNIFKFPYIRPIYADGLLVVATVVNYDEHGSWTSWILPGGYTTTSFDAVRDYVTWIEVNGLHKKGAGLEVV